MRAQCPVCGHPVALRRARWTQCPSCLLRLLVPVPELPMVEIPCTVCGDLVATQGDEEDVVCLGCFEANLQGGLGVERPVVGRLARED